MGITTLFSELYHLDQLANNSQLIVGSRSDTLFGQYICDILNNDS